MATALIASIALRWWAPFAGKQPVVFAKTALTTTAITTLVWLVVTYLTAPEPESLLLKFYRQVRPHVTGWLPIARLAPEVAPTRDLGRNLLSWVLGCAMVYSALFGGGWLLLGPRSKGILFLAIAAACGWALSRDLTKRSLST
jgi:hypothetical protein